MESSAPEGRPSRIGVASHPPVPAGSATPDQPPPTPGNGGAGRPSFASPTRASLSRFNPDILGRRTASPKRKRIDDAAQPGQPQPTSSVYSQDSLTQALATHLALAQRPDNLVSPGAGSGLTNNDDASAGIRSPAKRAGIIIPRSPRPFPPRPADNGDGGLPNPFSGRTIARSPLAESLEPEPELPPTPEHPDPVVSTPPSGIHNTPSRRPKRTRESAQRPKHSSPLKQAAARPSAMPTGHLPRRSTQWPTFAAAAPEPLATPSELRGIVPAGSVADKKRLKAWIESQSDELRHTLLRASTENQSVAQKHQELFRSNPVVQPVEEAPPTPGQKTGIMSVLRSNVFFQGKKTKPSSAQPEDDEVWISAAEAHTKVMGPFTRGQLNEAPSYSPTTEEQFQLDHEQSQMPIKSHHPIRMTVQQAMIYFQTFTPLEFDGDLDHHVPLDAPRINNQPFVLHHYVHITAAYPFTGLFHARIEFDVNMDTQNVTELTVTRLHPAAKLEFSPFLDIVCVPSPDAVSVTPRTVNSNHRRLVNNCGALFLGMSEWMRVAAKRAKFWKVLDRDLDTRDKQAVLNLVRKFQDFEIKKQSGAGKKGGRRGRPANNRASRESDEWEDVVVNDSSIPASGRYTRAFEGVRYEFLAKGQPHTPEARGKKYEKDDEFLAEDLMDYMGRTSWDYDIPVMGGDDGEDDEHPSRSVQLRVQWRIEMSGNGEASSDIGVVTDVPANFYQFDQRSLFEDVQGIFATMLECGENPIDAVRAIACLLSGALGRG